MSEIITRACGHTVAFEPAGDRWDDARRDKLKTRNCPACGEAKNRADNAARKATRIKKGSEVKALPDGSAVTLTLRDGVWSGNLTAAGVAVETQSAGAMGILSKLARKWLRAAGVTLQGAVKE